MTVEVRQNDCMKGLLEIDSDSVDLVLTDPPYGIGFQSRSRTKTERFDKITNDDAPFIWFLPECWRILKSSGCIVVFCRWDVQETFAQALRLAGFTIKSELVWDKEAGNMGDLSSQFSTRHEKALFAIKPDFTFPGGRPSSVVRVPRVDVNSLVHPTEKPVALMRFLVDALTRPGGLVVDPFVGSGSVGVACLQGGRNFVGFEIVEEYVRIARERCSQKPLVVDGFLAFEKEVVQ